MNLKFKKIIPFVLAVRLGLGSCPVKVFAENEKIYPTEASVEVADTTVGRTDRQPNKNPTHTAGKTPVIQRNFTSCTGGYKEDVYLCKHCGEQVFKKGVEAVFSPADDPAVHTPGAEVVKTADFVACLGGYKNDVYKCVHCDGEVFADGSVAVNSPREKPHGEMITVAEKEPTPQENGNFLHYICQSCNLKFFDFEATIPATEEAVVWGVYKDAFSPEDITQDLKDKNLDTVEKINRVLVEKVEDSFLLTLPENRDKVIETVLWDVKYIAKNPVTGEREELTTLPEGGIDVLIPYPDNAYEHSHDFYIFHMISNGEQAGEIELLQPTKTPKGLRVHFDSFSPVMVAFERIFSPEETQQPHLHTWIVQWKYDLTHHWYECSDCGEKDEFYSHVYSGDSDRTCNICGYKREIIAVEPTARPLSTAEPVAPPVTQPVEQPTTAPIPTPQPTAEPAPKPTATPEPTVQPTATASRTPQPTKQPPQQPHKAESSLPVLPVVTACLLLIALLIGVMKKKKADSAE